MPYTYEYPRPVVTADAAVFALRGGSLRVCLVRRGREPFAGRWVMPGGFVGIAERAAAGARRELMEETGLEAARLAFLRPYDDPERDPRGRIISLAFFGVAGPGARPRAGDDAAEAVWAEAHEPPPLAFDHALMLRDALESLRRAGRFSAMLFGMLDSPFTLAQAREAYAAVYPGGVNAAAFTERLLASGVLRPAPDAPEGPPRGGALYELSPDADAALEMADRPLFTPKPA